MDDNILIAIIKDGDNFKVTEHRHPIGFKQPVPECFHEVILDLSELKEHLISRNRLAKFELDRILLSFDRNDAEICNLLKNLLHE
jgi:hypothetical protein